MKVKYDYQIFGTQKYGGISKYFFYLAKELNKTENEAKIIAPLYVSNIIKDAKFVFGKFIHTESRLILRFIKYLNMIIDLILFSFKKYDISHKTYYSVISDSTTPKNSKKIITVFDMTHEVYPNYFKDSAKLSKYKKITCEQAHKIICISNSTKKDLIKYFGVDEKKINVIYLGVDSSIFKISKKKNQMPLLPEKFILYVGNRNGYKNFKLLLKMFKKNKVIRDEFKLIIFGGEKASLTEKKEINNANLENNLIFLNGDDYFLSYLYNNATVLVYTSVYEGFGLPLIEAMACGCPVIAYNKSSIPEVLGNSGILLQDENDDAELSNSIYKLNNNKNFRTEVINLGLERAKEFSWKKCALQTLKVYEKD